jgi:hypothetical protein
MADDRTLPGWPKKKLVKDVRRHLARYGIRPSCLNAWRTTWVWAEAITRSYWQTHWPLPSEIATQYVLLLLAEMKKSHMLNLPYRADTVLPPEVAAALVDVRGTDNILLVAHSSRSTKPRSSRHSAGPGHDPSDCGETGCALPSSEN